MKKLSLGAEMKGRLVRSALLMFVLAMILFSPLRQAVFENPLLVGVDEAAESHVDASFKRALTAFALARATNAVISVIQETHIEASPAGVGVSIALGEVLDPVNDLVERFSWVMLVALTSLGIQKFLIEISPWLSIQVLGVIAVGLWLAGIWVRERWSVDLTRAARTLVILALVVRFAVPAMAWLNEGVYAAFLEDRYAEATATVAKENERLRDADPSAGIEQGEEGAGMWDRLRAILGRAEKAADFDAVIDWVREKSTGLIENFLSLIVVFVLNTVLLPIAFLWG
ncbi:MAG: hypothetical protein GWN87_06840, partial [Desulfuromonadales bacterium]|nr:hypothetical protein [Desulfuromonadales bacterium]NIS40288.1 hypothetical protein [Desulfuromonadales bacterium]